VYKLTFLLLYYYYHLRQNKPCRNQRTKGNIFISHDLCTTAAGYRTIPLLVGLATIEINDSQRSIQNMRTAPVQSTESESVKHC